MLTRLLKPLPIGTSRRAYSFFSSKPGGGRYFNSAKPHKVAPAAGTTTSRTKSKQDEAAPSSSPSPTSDDTSAGVLGQEDTSPAESQASPFSARPIPSTPHLPPHPTFSGHTYPLHHFFSLHRPLLLLPLTTSTLFESPSASFDHAISPPPPSDASTSSTDEIPESPADADADAARQLARALALNRVGGWIDWEDTLARLGDPACQHAFCTSDQAVGFEASMNSVNMDSTKRKKRKKMSKHKYKKRRRLQRAERRKMGK